MASPPPDACANCGAAIPRGAKSCPECGADERTGWRDDDATRYDGLDLPESAFADEAEGAAPSPRREVNGVPWLWWCVGVVLLGLLIIGTLRLF